jgi:Domain of unknown function (DUF4328)
MTQPPGPSPQSGSPPAGTPPLPQQAPPTWSPQPYPATPTLAGPPPGHSPAFEPSKGLGTAVIVMAVAYTVIAWLLALIATAVTQSSQKVTTGGATTAVVVYGALSVLGLLMLIVEYVLTGIWLGRARKNADRIAPDQQRRPKIWVWLSWIVPIVSLWFPKQVIDDVWRSTVRDPSEPSTGWWWGTWIAASVIGNITALAGGNLVVFHWIDAAILTVAVVFWVRVVRTVSDAQDALAAGTATSPA